jgi:glucose/arabinose dehydrogenase
MGSTEGRTAAVLRCGRVRVRDRVVVIGRHQHPTRFQVNHRAGRRPEQVRAGFATLLAMPRAIAATLLLIAAILASCGSPSPSSLPSAAVPSGVPSGSPVPPPTASLPGSTNPPLDTGPDRLALEPLVSGLAAPVGLVAAGDGSNRLFVLERGGVIRVIEADGSLRADPFVDLSDRIVSGGERGLLGLAFHPDFARNRRLFVHYSRKADGATVVAELRADADLQRADPGSERILLTVPQPYANHNGGKLAFGPDGYLYLGLGDGGSGGDPHGNAQNTQVLLGKILRLDVDGTPASGRAYAIPPDNPFAPNGVHPGEGLPEIWAYGLRNPWRFSFDPRSGDLYIGDVGQGSYEEIDRQPSDSPGGENYGWSVMEGRHCYQGTCDQAGYVKPIAEYSHDVGCSVSGGEVYRGDAQPDLVGVYVFGDYCGGQLMTLQVDEGTVTPKVVAQTGLSISAFGAGEDGEIYVVDLGGSVQHVVVDG